MAVSRRRFLRGATSASAAAATTPIEPPPAPAAPQIDTFSRSLDIPTAANIIGTAALPPIEIIALNRMGYGPRPGDVAAFRALGTTPDAQLQAYVDQQLNPDSIDDSECDARIAAARLKIKYDADMLGRYPAMNEARGLVNLAKQTAELWSLSDFKMPMAFAERIRPFEEVRCAAWYRAVYSKRQLKELLVEFWHNHFNVNASGEGQIYTTFPVYDRDVIRKNCLGNFRAFLEDVAKSTAMLYYLDNVSNKAGGGEGGNENYARELLELHTFGSDNYYKFYNDRTKIPTVQYNAATYVAGYIDDDVYEAARSFTGWTVQNGNREFPKTVPNTGEFFYYDNWHDTYPKTFLSTTGIPNIPRSQPAMKDGRDVLDLLASHPNVARFICTKLCRRLIADSPPAAVVDAAVAEWMSNLGALDQIKRVVRVILLSSEFKTTWGQKVKRPFEAIVSYLRATDATLPMDIVDPADPNKGAYWGSIVYNMSGTGHKIFEWPTPTGHPDIASYWISTNSTLRRWNLPFTLAQWWGGNIVVPIVEETDLNKSCIEIVDDWIGRLCGFPIDEAVRDELIAFMAQGGDASQPPKPTRRGPDWGNMDGVKDRLRGMVQLLAASPDFHAR